jgi:hypothetical protein
VCAWVCSLFFKSTHFFPTFNFGPINDTLKNISNINTSPVDLNNNKSLIDFNNNYDIEYEDKPEISLNIEQLSLLNKHSQLRDISYSLTLEDDGTNPQSPLHSVKTFEELKLEPSLLNGIYYMGFRRPSRIQERALPQLLAYPPRNMIAQSQNGTGKTVEKEKTIILKSYFKYLGSIFISNTKSDGSKFKICSSTYIITNI